MEKKDGSTNGKKENGKEDGMERRKRRQEKEKEGRGKERREREEEELVGIRRPECRVGDLKAGKHNISYYTLA